MAQTDQRGMGLFLVGLLMVLGSAVWGGGCALALAGAIVCTAAVVLMARARKAS